MLMSKLPYRICWSKKCRFLLLGAWLSFTLVFICSLSLFDVQSYIPIEATTSLAFSTNSVWNLITKSDNLADMIKFRNEEQVIRNLDKFGPITNDTIVIIIQTHRRKVYLQALIDSLKDAKYINETLLVFSHGYYEKDINDIVESINFTRVLQIFFPYSLQTHPNTFPGFTPGDCPHGEIPKNCFGKARDVKSLQVKHHWWWKVNMVFKHLRVTQDFEGLVLLLEEDHYVFPDVLHVLKLMWGVSLSKCPDCNVFGVGRNPEKRGLLHYQGLSDKVSVQQWNNMGFAFTREFWDGLKKPSCSKMFCEYNDYNWDFTLAYLSHKCLPSEIKPLTVVSPRVFHIGDCGVHFHGTNCKETKSLEETRALQKLVAPFLFPKELMVISTDFRQWKVDGHNGGWDDARDIELCKNISRH